MHDFTGANSSSPLPGSARRFTQISLAAQRVASLAAAVLSVFVDIFIVGMLLVDRIFVVPLNMPLASLIFELEDNASVVLPGLL